jgi:RHS repeat-associated protein
MPTVAVDAGSGSTSNTNPVVTYAAWQGVGLPRSGTSAGSPAAAPTPDTIGGRVTDPVSHVSKYTANRYGQPMVATNAASQVTTYLRSGFLPYEIDRADGGVDQFTYDSYGRVTWQQPSGRESTSFTRNGLYAQVDSIKGNGSRNEVLHYDGSGNLTRVDYAVHSGDSAQYVTYAYDATTKQLATVTDQNGNETGYFFDSKFGNVDSTESANGRIFSTRRFDVYGRDSATRGSGTTTFTTLYDTMNRPTRYKDGVHSDSMLVRYDALDDTSLTDRLGNTYRSVHNALGWVTQSCDASANCSSFRYDASGALTSSTNRRSQRIDLVRDALGRVTSKSGTNTNSDSFSYAANGHDYVASNGVEIDSVFVSPGNGSTAASDSVVSILGGMRFRTFHFARRGMSGVDSTSIATSVSGLAMNARKFFYSDVGALDSIGTGIHKIRLARNSNDLPSKFTSSGGAEETLTATALQAPRDRKNNYAPLDSAFRRSYHYDSATRVDQSQNATTSKQRVFTYDLLGQLTNVDFRSSCSASTTDSLSADGSGLGYTCANSDSTQAYTYDAMGNRTDHSGSSGTGNRQSDLNGGTMSYNADGDAAETAKSGVYHHEYFWSAESLLDSARSDGTYYVKYSYNALQKPAIRWRKVSGGSWAIDSFLIWDGDQLVLELDSLGNRKADYIYFPGSIDQPAVQTIGATSVTAIRDFRMDASGNVTGTVDGTAVSQTVSYDSWGVPADSGNTDNRLLWKGLMWEGPVDSLYYVRNRWYDPQFGRFINEDPIGHAGGENLYAFGGNDPVNASDPSGTMDCHTEWGQTMTGDIHGYTVSDWSYEVCEDDGGPPDVGLTWIRPEPGTPSPGGGPSAPAKPPVNLLFCAEASGNLVITAVADYTGATELRAAFRAADAALTLGTRYIELNAYRNAGLIGKTRFARVATPVAKGALALAGGAGGHLASFAQGQVQTAELGTAMNSLSLWDFVPIIATGRALTKAVNACMP